MRTRSLLRTLLAGVLAAAALPSFADGPADNVPAKVRPIPKPGIELSEADRKELEAGLEKLDAATQVARKESRLAPGQLELALNDIAIYHRAVRTALDHGEFFALDDVQKAKSLIAEGTASAGRLARGEPNPTGRNGLALHGYVSKIDGTVQPYGLTVPKSWRPDGERRYRLDVWCHGRNETLSEIRFLADPANDVARAAAADADAFVLYPYGRFCNANKFAGEVDVLEAIEDVKRRYRIDDDRVVIRGFSMGGASAWQFAVHYADRWCAANPGAGFAETPRFLNVFQNEQVQPTWYERKLWNLYDCDKWALNLVQCPTVAYSGEIDKQKQAADVMAEALAEHGIPLTHVIGPNTAHKYEPGAAKIVAGKLADLAEVGRDRFPRTVQFETYTLKYNSADWVTVDAIAEHWERAHVVADLAGESELTATTGNVTALTFAFPPGRSPFVETKPVTVAIDGQRVAAPPPSSDRSWSLSLHKAGDKWEVGPPPAGLRKTHGLQGPIDDAFMDSFVFVRPTGESKNPKFAAWAKAEMDRAIEQWRTHFRGDARVKDDTAVTDDDIATANLVLWGDADSNAVLKRIAGDLPIRWTPDAIAAGDRSFPAAGHALAMIYPNPRNPARYVVLNSGVTFREYAYLNNARQVPMLPDWAVIDLSTPPDAVRPGRIAAADFFGERWELRPPHEAETAAGGR